MNMARRSPGFTISKLLGSPVLWLVVIVGGVGLSIAKRSLLSQSSGGSLPHDQTSGEGLKVYYQLPEFSLADQNAKPFGARELQGKVWIANFIFTHCPTRCEELTRSMAQLQASLQTFEEGKRIKLISFSVDPENDTPQVLAKYSDKHSRDPAQWRFLTGDLKAVQSAVVKGFKLPMQKQAPTEDEGSAMMNITHGTRLVLVDRKLRIRGYYETDPEAMKKLLKDAKALQSERAQ